MPAIRIPRHLGVALGLMLFVSCSNPQWVCGCDPVIPTAVLYGRVTDAAGAPVASASVTAEQVIPSCAGDRYALNDGLTGADGRYRMHVALGGDTSGRCLRAYASAPAGTAPRWSDTVPFTVRFTTEATLDSVRVDLVLRAP
jgi:hypothetical protein